MTTQDGMIIHEGTDQTRVSHASVFSSMGQFEDAQRMAKSVCASSIIPAVYQGEQNIPNVLVALELSRRCGISPLAVMQNLHVIQGRPSWSSAFVIASINSCGKFSPLRFRLSDLGVKNIEYEIWSGPRDARKKLKEQINIRNVECVAMAHDISTGEMLEGPAVSIEMAVHEGWYTKTDSKWKTMPDLMLRYRAAAFFGRLYVPELLLGMSSQEEIEDTSIPARVIEQPIDLGAQPVPASRMDAKRIKPGPVDTDDGQEATSNQEGTGETPEVEAPPAVDLF